VLELCGVQISRSDAWWIVDQLRTIGRADDAVCALGIEQALLDDLESVDLAPSRRQSVLGVLTNCPRTLTTLRVALIRDDRGEGRPA
jgi:hypothetical protein